MAKPNWGVLCLLSLVGVAACSQQPPLSSGSGEGGGEAGGLAVSPSPATGSTPVTESKPLSAALSVPETAPFEVGRVTWYRRSRHTHTTASGEALDDRLFTAAHRRLPFGSFVRAIDLSTRHSVIVRINDRGPFTKGFILDLSKAAAEALGVFKNHKMVIGLEILAKTPHEHPAATEISNLPTGKAALAALLPAKAGTRKSATRPAPGNDIRAKAKIAPNQSKRGKPHPPKNP